MTFAGEGPMKMDLKEQKSDGEILFDAEAGRMHSSKLNQDLAMSVNVGGQAIEQTIHQVVDVKVAPAK
jgi:hypothetical protein